VRLSFFSVELKDKECVSTLQEKSFLGYAILKKILLEDGRFRWIVFESVIAVTRHENNYLHKLRKYKVCVGGQLFSVGGVLYCQQNGLTNVCAHATLRTCLSIITPPADFSYSLMNKILKEGGKPHVIRHGLDVEQICLILKAAGVKYSIKSSIPLSGSDQENESYPIPYQSFLYGSIESGYPALLGFSLEQGEGHIIPVFGHTFNEDTWVPAAKISYFEIGKDTRYVPSETWVSTYICHDDNFGSYYCLPRNYLTEEKNAITVIALRPAQTEVDAILAEAIAADYLYTLVPIIVKEGELNEWARRLARAINEKHGWFVLRTLCMSSDDYIEHLRLLKGWDSKTIPTKLIAALSVGLPQLLWVVEISLPELFPANRRKLGEVVLDAGKVLTPTQDLSNLVLVRILNSVYCFERSQERIGLTVYNAEIDTHTDLCSIQTAN